MKNAIYKSAFAINPLGHGGERRSAQIYNFLVNRFQLTVVNEHKSVFETRFKRYSKGFLFLFRNKLPYKSLDNIAKVGFVLTNLEILLKENPIAEFFFWEPTYLNQDYLIPFFCKKNNIELVAFPHNIESLVIKQKSYCSDKIAPNWFYDEIRLLSMCNFVVTISREEQWLLSLNNIFCVYFPYMPPRILAEDLLTIRKNRLNINVNNNNVLCLGTFTNYPTKEGIIDLVKYWLENDFKETLLIAGYGTEELHKYYSILPTNIQILGSVTQTNLNTLLTECKFIFLHQVVSTGALTKLIEFQFAGIPVVANSMALRNYHNIRGFYHLEDLSFLKMYLSVTLEIPEIPEKVGDFEENIILQLNKIKRN